MIKSPCAAPAYTLSRLPGIACAVLRPVKSMGAPWSASPWMIKVGTVKAAMSFRRSVSDIARIMSVIALGEAGKNNPTAQ